jgi:AbiTii
MIKKILNYFKKPQMLNKPVSLFEEIKSDILGNTDLSQILLKAKVLAYKLKNNEFKEWVESELNGYDNLDLLPDYRVISTKTQGDFGNRFRIWKNMDFPLHLVDKDLQFHFNEIQVNEAINELESFLESIKTNKVDFMPFSIPQELIVLLNSTTLDDYKCLRAWSLLTKGNINRIISTTRNRLLGFILTLADKYPELKSDADLTQPIPDEQIKQVFNISILGWKTQVIGLSEHTTQGENMSVFNQQGQTVNTQYNAAGDINFSSIQNSTEFVAELIKLKNEFSKVAQEEAINAEIVTDTEYQLTKAIQQAEKPEPNKEKIIGHLETAKQIVDGVETLAKIGTGLYGAIEIVKVILG